MEILEQPLQLVDIPKGWVHGAHEHAEVARSRWHLARVLESRGRYRDAIAAHEAALALADRTQTDPKWKAVARLDLALLIHEHRPRRRTDAVALARESA